MKIRLEPKSEGIAEIELFAETPEEKTALKTLGNSGFCQSVSESRSGLAAVWMKVLSPNFEREIRKCSRQTVDTLDAVRSFLAPLANQSVEMHALAGTDVRITHSEEAPKCPDCGAATVQRGAVFDCLNCGTRVGG